MITLRYMTDDQMISGEVRVESNASLDDVLRAFEDILWISGYSFNGQLEVIQPQHEVN